MEASPVGISEYTKNATIDAKEQVKYQNKQNKKAYSVVRCFHCNTSMSEKPKYCSACKFACYCSKECQRAHWKVHKRTCNK